MNLIGKRFPCIIPTWLPTRASESLTVMVRTILYRSHRQLDNTPFL